MTFHIVGMRLFFSGNPLQVKVERIPEYPQCMSIPVEKITEVALALSSDARALLADRLVESLDPITDDAVRDIWAAEARRRLKEVQSGNVQAIPGDVVLDRVRSLIGK